MFFDEVPFFSIVLLSERVRLESAHEDTMNLNTVVPIGCTLTPGAGSGIVIASESDRCAAAIDDGDVASNLLSRRYITVDATNLMETNVALALYFWRGAADLDHPDMYVTLGLFPGLRTRLSFDTWQLDGQQLFLDRTPGKLKSMVRGAGMRPDEVTRFGIGIMRSEQGARVEIHAVKSQDTEPDYPLPDVKLVDEVGQWKTRSWPGKTAGLSELRQFMREETDAVASEPSEAEGLSRWGGSTKTRFDASGFFRAHHDGQRYLLVDPDGYPFYSIGLDCVREDIDARVDGIEQLFDWLPERTGELAAYWQAGSTRFPTAQSFDFIGANMHRALGPDWFSRWAKLTERRMREWRFNTIGNWSSEAFIGASTIAYVIPLSGSIETQTPIFRDFPDVFSYEFERASDAHAKQLEKFHGDPRLLGYFIMNEPHWAFEPNLNVAEKLLANPAELASKDALIEFLSQRYSGDARKLAAAWSTPDITSFDDLRTPRTGVGARSEAAAADLDAFNTVLIRRFAQIPCEAARRADPDHLNLGMRFAFVSQDALYETGEYFDVFSINRYGPTAREQVDEIGARTNLPVMIGEFHHGALDAGLPSNGIRGVRTQAERAQAYRYFQETTAASPWAVGAHYFTLNDQPILGRFDGENFQIGIVDICQRPYADFVRGAEQTNGGLYEVVLGEREPTDFYPEEATVGF